MATFEIIWFSQSPVTHRHAACGRTEITRHDLTDAITAAANLIKSPRGDEGAKDAHGFYVQVKR